MKKKLLVLLCCICSLSFMACGGDKKEKDNGTKPVTVQSSEVEVEVPDEEEAEYDYDSSDPTPDGEGGSTSGVDLDLTSFSATMVYSEVFNMIVTPEEYEGKTIKMEGTCNLYTEPSSGKTYYSCIVQDATQCCQQGLEFSLDVDKYSKDDYPPVGEEITITGVFTTYMDNGHQYISINDSVLD